jgi:alanine racemase
MSVCEKCPDTYGLRTWVEIDTDAIKHNVAEIRKLIGKTKIMGIVKADAYGHGSITCTKAMEEAGVDYFAVAALEEGIELREAGIESPVLILGYTPPARFDDLIEYDLIQTAVSADYGRELNAYGKSIDTPIMVHLKIDTGMNRTGLLYQDGAKDTDEILEMYSLPYLDIIGIFSHFPVSDDLGEESTGFTKHQMELFDDIIDKIKAAGFDTGIRHIQNSYGILNYFDAGYDYCRPGLLYMGVTSDESIPILSSPDFIPALSWKAKVSMVKTVPAGATVSYGRHYRASEERKIASLTVGYADGLPRAISNKPFEVLIKGHRVPLVGNICMDQCMADITGFDDIQSGDVVTIVGSDGKETVPVDAISQSAGTINNETLTRLGTRVKRILKP